MHQRVIIKHWQSHLNLYASLCYLEIITADFKLYEKASKNAYIMKKWTVVMEYWPSDFADWGKWMCMCLWVMHLCLYKEFSVCLSVHNDSPLRKVNSMQKGKHLFSNLWSCCLIAFNPNSLSHSILLQWGVYTYFPHREIKPSVNYKHTNQWIHINRFLFL